MRRESKALCALSVVVFLFALATTVHAEQGLVNCAEQFPQATVDNAPTVSGTAANVPAAGKLHVCRRSGNVSFFALEYDPERYAPLWVAYRITNTFGEGGCASMTRREMRCHFQADDVAGCIATGKEPPDPFHMDPLLSRLKIKRLGTSAFSGTGHDRGHLAPNNALSWHACGAYKTFTMANMAAQWGSLNRQLWASLEAQVLYWGVKHGPVFVTTGPLWRRFPVDRVNALQDGTADPETIPGEGERLRKLNGESPKQDIALPTGFFTVVYTPATHDRPAHAIAFLVPHTKQTGLSFWHFVSTISLVEETTDLRFGFSDALKGWPDFSYWRGGDREAPAKWDVRAGCQARLPVAGWMDNISRKQRLKICASSDPIN